MAEFFPNATEVPGDRKAVAYASQYGNYSVNDLAVRGDATITGTTRCNGNLILGSTSVVDVDMSTIYTFGDPLINLNTTFTGLYVPISGLEVFRGPGFDEAMLTYVENADRSSCFWKVGLGADVLRIARVPDSMFNRGALYWQDSDYSVCSSAAMQIQDTYISSTIPLQQKLTSGSLPVLTQIVADDTLKSEVQWFSDVGHYPAFPDNYLRTKFRDITFAGIDMGEIPVQSALQAMQFAINGSSLDPDISRRQYLFGNMLAIGNDSDGAAVLFTGLNNVRLSAATEVDLAINFINEVQLTSSLLTVNVPADFGLNTVTVSTLDAGEVDTEALTYTIPPGVQLFPTIPTWTPTTGTPTYMGLTTTVSNAQSADYWSYRVLIDYTQVAPPGEVITLVCPIYLGGSQANLRNLSGVNRKMSGPPPGGVPVLTYGLPEGALWIQEPFDVDANLTAARSVGYQYLMVNIRQKDGSWQIDVTITQAVT